MTNKIFKEVSIDLVLDNPFKGHGIKQIYTDHVDDLAKAIDRGKFRGSLLARPYGNKYQIAYGHHRVEALKKLGVKVVTLELDGLSDNDMVYHLAQENALQRGHSQSAVNESVHAITTLLATALLRFGSFKELNTAGESPAGLARAFPTGEYSFANAKKYLKQGRGLGREIILNYLDNVSISSDSVDEAVEYLRDTGKVKEIVERISAAIAAEQEAIEKAEQEAEAKAKAKLEADKQAAAEAEARARRKAKADELEAKERAKAIVEKAKRKKAEAEARAKRQAAEAKARAEREAQEAKLRAKREAEVKQAQLRRQEAENKRQAAELAARQQRERSVDPAALELFKDTTLHQQAFRSAMSTEDAQRVFDPNQHVAIAKAVIHNAEVLDRALTSALIANTVAGFIREGKIVLAQEKKRVDVESFTKTDTFGKYVILETAVTKALAVLNDKVGAFSDFIEKHGKTDGRVTKHLYRVRQGVHRLHKTLVKFDKLLAALDGGTELDTLADLPDNQITHNKDADIIDVN